MRRRTPITLVSRSYTQNDIGVPVPSEISTQIFARVTSVTGKEWFEGGRIGLNPEFRAEILAEEYDGQEILEKDGVRYSIYRTYQQSNDILELYCEKRKGIEAESNG